MSYPNQQPQYGDQTGGQPGSAIALTTKYFPLTFMFAFFKPVVTVNGHTVPGSWGRTAIPVPPGQHHVHVHVPYFLPSKVGSADLTVPVHPGQTAELEYRAPVIVFMGGSLGAPPQKYNGMPALIALMAVSVLLIVCSCIVPIITAASGQQ